MNSSINNNTSGDRNPISLLMKPVQDFIRMEASGGILLLAAATVALVWANSPWGTSYQSIFQTRLEVGYGDFGLNKPLILWINDGLMAIFFLLVGLEIKRELLTGELSNPKKAALPIAAAIGGMVLPAGLYALLNFGGAGAPGWGIPMATDIAFALGILALAGPRVPLALKVFLTAFAIIDDLGAVLVIAFFYTSKLSVVYLLWAGGLLLFLGMISRLGNRSLLPYLILGIAIWYLFLKSGIHATIAGVLLAVVIPHRKLLSDKNLANEISSLSKNYSLPDNDKLEDEERETILHRLEVISNHAQTPLIRLEHSLHPWVSFAVMPIFALANAGVSLSGTGFGSLLTPVGLGIVLGLIVGKQLGVLSFAWLAKKLNIASLPQGVNWRHIYGAAILGGVGFTMSLFINGLAFDGQLKDVAKLAILTASALNGIAGFLVIKSASK